MTLFRLLSPILAPSNLYTNLKLLILLSPPIIFIHVLPPLPLTSYDSLLLLSTILITLTLPSSALFSIESGKTNAHNAHNENADNATILEKIKRSTFLKVIGSDPIPLRYIKGCDNDRREAKRRWEATKRWRKDENISTILTNPHPLFPIIKQHYPHFYSGRSKTDSIIYFEICGKISVPSLKKHNISVSDLVWHYIYMTEYCFNNITDDDNKRTCTVFDVEGVRPGDLSGIVLEFLKKTSSIMQDHYPERSEIILVINSPNWFYIIWNVVKQFINSNTLKKVRILSKRGSLEGMKEFIDVGEIPVEYGGEKGKDKGCRFWSEEEVGFREWVRERTGEVITEPGERGWGT
ncbi:hypothetical protein TrVE_jg12766 [Triparma verrucosa]|uniref:CRAL-TRIO domain-containing protein n=1 Tax=Triparma verrucosa TaxID=1606542 RepID=A0A9W7CH18_9STRA|nr:hypothetical protein TrVE_jg12766 [Triparma verrucosa]